MRENSPKISVVIPTYNRQDLLNQALESILNQTYQDFEAIIVDDGSSIPIQVDLPDNSRIRIISHPSNMGASAARNTGIKAARGELVAFLDSDDLWLPEKLALQAEFMNLHPHFGACVSSYHLETIEGHSIVKLKKPKSWLRELAQGCRLGPGTTLVVRHTCYDRTGYYDVNMPRLEDLDWLLRFIRDYDIGVIERPLATVRPSGNPSALSIETGNRTIIERHGSDFMQLGKFYGRQAIGKRWFETAVYYFANGDKKTGWRYLRMAIRENPVQRPGLYLRIFDAVFGTAVSSIVRNSWFGLKWRNSR